MSADIVFFPRQKLRPDAVEVQSDFGRWTLAYFSGKQFRSRLDFASKELAEAEAKRLVIAGALAWRMGPNGVVHIEPVANDGGEWGVFHTSRSEDSHAFIERHFSFDVAADNAIRIAREMGATFTATPAYSAEPA